MAIMGFIIVVAGKVYSDSTGMRIRTQSMTKATESVNATAAILKEDIGRMGVKQWKDENNVFTVNEEVYIDLINNDTSSFILDRSEVYDELTFKTMDFNLDGTFLAVREIKYRVNDENELVRECETLEGDPGTECPESTLIVANVETFSLNPSIPGVRPENGDLDASITAATELVNFGFSSDDNGFALIKRPPGGDVLDIVAEPKSSDNKIITLTGFTKNPTSQDATFAQIFLAEPLGTECLEFEFLPGETYAIDFDLMPSPPPSGSPPGFCHICLFQAGEDHIALGLRRKGEWDEPLGVPDFVVLSPSPIQSDNPDDFPRTRHQKFSVPEKIEDACVSLKFAFYSRMVSGGKLEISNFKVYSQTNEVYHFATGDDALTYNPGITPNTDITFKKMVKAFELDLGIKIKNEVAKAKVVIPVPNNGVFAESTNP